LTIVNFYFLIYKAYTSMKWVGARAAKGDGL